MKAVKNYVALQFSVITISSVDCLGTINSDISNSDVINDIENTNR